MRDALKWTVIVGTFLLPCIPLIVTGSLFFSYITGKNFVFRIIVEIIFAAWALLALYDKKYRPRFSWVAAAFTVFVGSIFVADIFGVAPAKSIWSNFERMEGFVTLAHLLMYFVVAGSVLTSEKLWARFFIVSLATAALISLYAFAQLAGLVGIAQGGVRIDATLGNAIYMAAYMLFSAFIALFMLAKSPQTGARVLYGGLALVFMFLLVQTATRGTIIGLVGGLLTAGLYGAFFSRDNRTARRVALGVVALLLVVSGLFYAVRNSAFVQQSPILNRVASISPEAGRTRVTIWSIALEGVKERPILGWGQSNFDYVFDAHYQSSLYAQEPWFDRVHNIVLDWLIAGGIVGFLAYLAIWIAVWYALRHRSRVAPYGECFSVVERAVLFGLLVGYGLHNMFVFDNLISYFFFVTILALAHTRAAKEIPRLSAVRVDERIVTHVAAPVVGIVLCLSLYYVNVPNIRAAGGIIDALSSLDAAVKNKRITVTEYNVRLMRGLDAFKQALASHSFADQEIREQIALTAQRVYLDTKANTETKSAYITLAESELQKQVDERPGAARMHAFFGTFYRTIGQTDKALEQLAIVRAISPNKQSILFDIGATYIARKEYDTAKEVLKEAFMRAPEYDEARAYYIVAAIYAGDDALVAELSAPPYDALYREHDLILQTYYLLKNYDRVLQLLMARIEKNPDDVQLRVSYAAVQYERGDTASAVETLQRAIKDFPKFKTTGEQYINEIKK